MVKRRTTPEDAPSETEVRITWRQWPDGRWEAWVTHSTGQPPRLARDRAELERLLLQVCRREREARPVELDRHED